jgi:hypothetical protein
MDATCHGPHDVGMREKGRSHLSGGAVTDRNNTVAARSEWLDEETTAVVSFEYDNRQRLINETRVVNRATTQYDLAYTYDQLGNRLTKYDAVTETLVTYAYDVHTDPNELTYATRHNRLLEYRVWRHAGGGTPDPNDPNDLRRTVTYTYYETGDVSNVTLKDRYVDPNETPGDPNDYDWYHDLALYPYTNGTVAAALWDRWRPDPNGLVNVNDPNQYQRLAARGFMYEGDPRARFYDRALDPNTLSPLSRGDPDAPEHWTDHAGSAPWGDFEVRISESTAATREHTRWLGTAALERLDPSDPNADPDDPNADPNDPNAWSDRRYLHGDLIDSTGLLTDDVATDDGATSVSSVFYTAFGEILDPASGSPLTGDSGPAARGAVA